MAITGRLIWAPRSVSTSLPSQLVAYAPTMAMPRRSASLTRSLHGPPGVRCGCLPGRGKALGSRPSSIHAAMQRCRNLRSSNGQRHGSSTTNGCQSASRLVHPLLRCRLVDRGATGRQTGADAAAGCAAASRHSATAAGILCSKRIRVRAMPQPRRGMAGSAPRPEMCHARCSLNADPTAMAAPALLAHAVRRDQRFQQGRGHGDSAVDAAAALLQAPEHRRAGAAVDPAGGEGQRLGQAAAAAGRDHAKRMRRPVSLFRRPKKAVPLGCRQVFAGALGRAELHAGGLRRRGAWPKRTRNSWRSRLRSAALNGEKGKGMASAYHAGQAPWSRFGRDAAGGVSDPGR